MLAFHRVVGAAHDGEQLPALYARWVEAIVGGALPRESHATCDRCAMCASAGPAGSIPFDAATKCCTYVPVLPNFVTGAVLADPDPGAADGRRSVLARIARRAGVTPLGVTRTRAQTLVHDHSTPAFGRAVALRCPHYLDREGGQCGIWRHRNAICSTWFCKHVHGRRGFALWRTVEAMLVAAERTLALWCALESGVEPHRLQRLVSVRRDQPHEPLDAADLDGREPDDYAEHWGRWRGREAELYTACAALVRDLVWSDVERIGGPELAMHRQVLQAQYAELARPQLPARLRPAVCRVIHRGRDTVRLQTYSPFDPIELPAELIEALHCFDGQPIAEALEQMVDEHALELTPELVQRLVDFDVLADAGSAGDDAAATPP